MLAANKTLVRTLVASTKETGEQIKISIGTEIAASPSTAWDASVTPDDMTCWLKGQNPVLGKW